MGIKKIMDNILYGKEREDEGDEVFETEEDEYYEEIPQRGNPYKAEGREYEQRGAANQQASGVSVSSGSSIEMKVVKPDRLDTVTQIADHLLARKTILLNLEVTNKETARRLIDFLNGVAYAINGNLKKVANSTYVITPSNVDISGEQLKESQENGDLF